MVFNTRFLVRLLSVTALAAEYVAALSPISVKGTKLYDEDGKQFFVKGIVYAPDEISNEPDALLDAKQCQIDASLISELGANTVRVYLVSDDGDHDGCMQAFANAGIYVWLDLPTIRQSFHMFDLEWTPSMYDTWTKTVDNFAGYDNVLFFTIANEGLFEDDVSMAPFIKAAVKDIKAFRNARGYRPIPIIYNAEYETSIRALAAEYLACDNEDEAIDAYGINVYSWCGNSSFYKAGYDNIYEDFQDLHVPVLFAETGCNLEPGDREFPDVQAMLGQVLQAVFSGVVVYEWAMHENEYGIVKYPTSNGQGFPSTLAEYNSLASVFSSMNPPGTSDISYTPTNTPPDCPSSLFDWESQEPLPTIAGLDTETISQRGSFTDLATKTPSDAESSGTRSTSGTSRGTSKLDETSDERESGTSEAVDDGASNGGLSGGAIGGIAAGIAVAVLIGAGVAACFLIRRRRANRQLAAAVVSRDDQNYYRKAELPVTSHELPFPQHELDGGHALGSAASPAEMGPNRVYELPAHRN